METIVNQATVKARNCKNSAESKWFVQVKNHGYEFKLKKILLVFDFIHGHTKTTIIHYSIKVNDDILQGCQENMI